MKNQYMIITDHKVNNLNRRIDAFSADWVLVGPVQVTAVNVEGETFIEYVATLVLESHERIRETR